jgi:glutaminyl-tRNA synthetase
VPQGQDWKTNFNPKSLEALKPCFVEPALAAAKAGERFQFERLGYFCVDKDTGPGALVFNRTVTLKDMWVKIQKQQQPQARKPKGK